MLLAWRLDSKLTWAVTYIRCMHMDPLIANVIQNSIRLSLLFLQAIPSREMHPGLPNIIRAHHGSLARPQNARTLENWSQGGKRESLKRSGGLVALRGGGSADTSDLGHVDWVTVVGSLFGGLSLFLYGMDQMGHGLKAAFGPQLRKVLLMLSFNR